MTPSELSARRVVFVLNWAVMGGAERFALDAAVHLRDEHDAHVAFVAFVDADGRARREAERLGIEWKAVPVSWNGSPAAKLRTIGKAASALRSQRPDVLLPVCTVPNVVCGLSWRATGARACVWNQRDLFAPPRFRTGTMRRAARRSTLVASCASHVAEFMEERYRVHESRSRVVWPGVELPRPLAGRDEWRARLGLQERDVAVCMLGHLHRFKDHATLLRAWRLVQDRRGRGPGAMLVLAGRPAGTQDALKALAFDLDLRDSIFFAGDVEDVSGLALACDVGALSSRSEGIGRSVIELMAAGLPFAGTDIAGIREAVGLGSVEWLAPPGDHARLAEILETLVGDAELRRRLGGANAARVAAIFSPAAANERYAAVVAEALDGTR